MSAPQPAVAASPGPKSFDDVDQYEREAATIIPGYQFLHELLPELISSFLPATDARVLVLGCGTGRELTAIVRAHGQVKVDGLDASAEMIDAARERIVASELEEQVSLHRCHFQDWSPAGDYHCVAATLVGHFIADDGARETFLRTIAASLRPGGRAVLTEFEHAGSAHRAFVDTHVRFSAGRGLPQERLELLHERLTTGFHLITRGRLLDLARRVGLVFEMEFLRALGLVGFVLRKPQ